jgi:nucleotide-binding universal stress UspA family protein
MQASPTILAAVALDRRDATVLRHAAKLASLFHARSVLAVHVAASSAGGSPAGSASIASSSSSSPAQAPRTIEEKLSRLVDEYRGLMPTATNLQAVIRHGNRVTELVQLAAETKADCLVIGRRPRDEHDSLSDAVRKLQWKAPCSVLIVPEGAAADYQRVLAACDFSEHSRDALRVAAAIRRAAPQGELTVEHVFALPSLPHLAGRSVDEFIEIQRSESRKRWFEFLLAGPAPNPLEGLEHAIRFDESEQVPRAVARAAIETDADLIVVGSHGLTPRAGGLLGHVADSVAAQTVRPYLCVKRKGEVVDLLQALLGLYENR